MNAVSPRAGYALWAPAYADETAISHLENRLAQTLTPPLARSRLLDAGCGVGRRMLCAGAAEAVGVDLSPEMLQAGFGEHHRRPGVSVLVGDVRALPLADAAFEVVWCRLVLGHLRDCAEAYAELARVCADGGAVVVSDFHPAAYAAGHRRTFRLGETVVEVEHHVHPVARHVEAARDAGLRLLEIRTARIGPAARPFYARADRLALYREHRGLPVVIAFAFQREGRPCDC